LTFFEKRQLRILTLTIGKPLLRVCCYRWLTLPRQFALSPVLVPKRPCGI